MERLKLRSCWNTRTAARKRGSLICTDGRDLCGIFFKDNSEGHPGKLLIRKAEIRHRPRLHHGLHGGFLHHGHPPAGRAGGNGMGGASLGTEVDAGWLSL